MEPEAFGTNEFGDSYHRNKWPKYQKGRPTPNKKLVDSVGARLPGTKAVLENPLWDALRATPRKSRSTLERELSLDVQRIAIQDKHGKPRGPVDPTIMRRLERQASIDALTCLIMFLRREDTSASMRFAVGRSIYRVFLILCALNQFPGENTSLFEVLQKDVFSLADSGEEQLEVTLEDFNFSLSLLEAVARAKSLEPTQKPADLLRAVMYGSYGADLAIALTPSIKFYQGRPGRLNIYAEFKRLQVVCKEMLSQGKRLQPQPALELWLVDVGLP